MSKKIPGGGGAKGGRRFAKGGRAGRSPGMGTSEHASKAPKGKGPVKGFGSKGLGGRPPKGDKPK